MSLTKYMETPFEGDNFQNFICDYCNVKPSDLGILADGINCPRCINRDHKRISEKAGLRYHKLSDRPADILKHYKELQKLFDQE
jgi:hypothetical protein